MDKITYLIKNSFRNQLRCCNVPPNIGYHAPKSLSTAATPELGMIPQGIRNKKAYTYPRTHKTHPIQHNWVYQAIKEMGKSEC